jgi:hypothetical protein
MADHAQKRVLGCTAGGALLQRAAPPTAHRRPHPRGCLVIIIIIQGGASLPAKNVLQKQAACRIPPGHYAAPQRTLSVELRQHAPTVLGDGGIGQCDPPRKQRVRWDAKVGLIARIYVSIAWKDAVRQRREFGRRGGLRGFVQARWIVAIARRRALARTKSGGTSANIS